MPMVTVECPVNPIPNVHVCGMWEETRVPGGELTLTKEKHKKLCSYRHLAVWQEHLPTSHCVASSSLLFLSYTNTVVPFGEQNVSV